MTQWNIWIISEVFFPQLLLVRRAERSERLPLSAAVWRGTPPRAGVGDVTPPLLRSMADFYCGVAAIQDRWFIIWKGASPPPLTPEVSVTRTSFRRRLHASARWHGSRTWRWRRTPTSSPSIRRSSEGDIGYALEVRLQWYVKSSLSQS